MLEVGEVVHLKPYTSLNGGKEGGLAVSVHLP